MAPPTFVETVQSVPPAVIIAAGTEPNAVLADEEPTHYRRADRRRGFVFIDEPFAHLDIVNIDRVAGFLKATQAQYLLTTPVTHNVNVHDPSLLTLVTFKKKPGGSWAPRVGVLVRDTR